jgi:hypothetical protein
MSENTSVYADILKYDDNGDGTLTVFGKATDDALDIDQQICDPVWLDKAMPDWFRTGGNIREQHSNIAAGVAQEYESKADGHYISALVVDPVSVKKVQNRVLRGFSIGIKSPRVVRDQKAANGRIIDGQIVEVSLVDRPANPNCQLVLAKSLNGEKTLTKVEELLETNIEEKEVAEDTTAMGGESKAIPSRDEMISRYASARKALDEITMECKSYGYEDIDKQYGESAEQETAEGPAGSGAEHELGEAKKEMVDQNENVEMSAKTTTKCLECGCNMPGATHGLTQVPVTGGTPANETANVSTATMITPDETPLSKSVETIVPPSTIEEVGTIIEEEDSDEDNSADKSLLADVKLNNIIEKAVKSAMESVEAEVALLKSAKEAVENKATELQTELATAKSLAIGGGPKRTTIATGANKTNEWKAKADLYYAKASATTDLILAKGYRDMAKDFLAKSAPEVESK